MLGPIQSIDSFVYFFLKGSQFQDYFLCRIGYFSSPSFKESFLYTSSWVFVVVGKLVHHESKYFWYISYFSIYFTYCYPYFFIEIWKNVIVNAIVNRNSNNFYICISNISAIIYFYIMINVVKLIIDEFIFVLKFYGLLMKQYQGCVFLPVKIVNMIFFISYNRNVTYQKSKKTASKCHGAAYNRPKQRCSCRFVIIRRPFKSKNSHNRNCGQSQQQQGPIFIKSHDYHPACGIAFRQAPMVAA